MKQLSVCPQLIRNRGIVFLLRNLNEFVYVRLGIQLRLVFRISHQTAVPVLVRHIVPEARLPGGILRDLQHVPGIRREDHVLAVADLPVDVALNLIRPAVRIIPENHLPVSLYVLLPVRQNDDRASAFRRSRRLLLRLCPPGRGVSFCLGAHGLLHRRVAGEPVQPCVSVRRDLLGEQPLDLVHAHICEIVDPCVVRFIGIPHGVVFLGGHALADHLICRADNFLGCIVVEHLVLHQHLRADGVASAVHGVHAEEHPPALGIGVRVAVSHLDRPAHRYRLKPVLQYGVVGALRLAAELPRVHDGHGLRAAVSDAELRRSYLP